MQASELVPVLWPNDAAWHTREALSLLEGTPFNCVVVEAAAQTLSAEASRRGLRVIELEAVPSLNVSFISQDTVWPSVKLGRRGEAEAGPTGPPWVDSNGWRCLLARAQAPAKMPWVLAKPTDEAPLRPDNYVVPVADAAAHGGRWLVTPPKNLPARGSEALEAWSSIVRAVRFFEEHSVWRTYTTLARLGVLSDFAGPNEFLGGELLNLAPRRYLSCRVLDVAHTSPSAWKGLKGILWVDERAPAGGMLNGLRSFVKTGGLLILPASAAHVAADKDAANKPAKKHKTGYRVMPSGEGRVAVAPEPWTDPYVLATDAHLLLSREHDIYRVFNSGATNVHCTESLDGRVVLHVINYTGRTGYNPMSVAMNRSYREARWWNLTTNRPEPLEIRPAAQGVEVHLPPFAAYAAVEFGGSR